MIVDKSQLYCALRLIRNSYTFKITNDSSGKLNFYWLSCTVWQLSITGEDVRYSYFKISFTYFGSITIYSSRVCFSLIALGPYDVAPVGDWGEWSQCSETCGEGTQTRNRLCLNLPPVYNPSNATNMQMRVCYPTKPCPSKFLSPTIPFESLL